MNPDLLISHGHNAQNSTIIPGYHTATGFFRSRSLHEQEFARDTEVAAYRVAAGFLMSSLRIQRQPSPAEESNICTPWPRMSAVLLLRSRS